MLKYEQIRVLGQGGFGKAILARKKHGQEKVVIKEVQLFSLQPRDREIAFQEAKLLSTLNYPFIISYLESFQERGNLYIVMEYADGGDLSQKVEKLREKRSSANHPKNHYSPYSVKNKNSDCFMSEDEVLHDFIQISLAIKYIHDRKILHRDLKTQNIFLMKDGTAKLGDFGISRVLQNTFQLCNTQIGTPYYLSPELCEGKYYNSKTDIWSLGCILYELCTLNRAFDANNMNQLIVNIIRGKHKPIDTTRYSNDLKNLVDSMLTKDPSKRPSINQILRLPFIKNRLSNFLNEKLLNYEMQHTILHGRKPFAEPTLILPLNNIQKNEPPKEEVKVKKEVKCDVKNEKIKKKINKSPSNKNVNIVDFDSKSLNLEGTKQLIETEKKKILLAQQKREEYEEKLRQAHERRQRRLKQEEEEKERKLREIQIQEKVKKSIEENKELIKLPKRKRDGELQIDAEERRRIYLEQKQEMLRNKRRYEQNQQSLLNDVYGNDQEYEQQQKIEKQKRLQKLKQERLDYLNRHNKNYVKKVDDNDSKEVDLNSKRNGFSNSIRRVSKNEDKNKNKNGDKIDMNEFYKQQRLDAALGIGNSDNKQKDEIDMDQLIKDAEEEIKNNQNDDEVPSPNKRFVKRKKQKEIQIEFLGMPNPVENNNLLKRSKSAFDKNSQFSPSSNEMKKSSRKIQPSPPSGSPTLKPQVGQAASRSPSEARNCRPKSHINILTPGKQIQVKNSDENNEKQKREDEKERETEIKMQNAIEQASAIVDALEISSTDYNDEEVDDQDMVNNGESQIENSFKNKKEFDKGESIPLILKDKTINFPIVKDSDSLTYRAEAIRAFLENEIGVEKLIKIYKILSDDNNTDDEKYEKYAENVIAKSGVEPGYIMLIQQLIVLDEKIGNL